MNDVNITQKFIKPQLLYKVFILFILNKSIYQVLIIVLSTVFRSYSQRQAFSK